MPTESDHFTEEEHVAVKVKAAFRVMGLDLEPAAVSRLLNLEPTKSHRRGDPRVGKSGRRYSDFSEGLWGWRPALAESEPLAEHLHSLLDVFEPRAAVLQRLKEMGLRLDFFIGVFGSEGNFAILLEDNLLERLGTLGVDLAFDVYCC